ncbi:hypothetical protein Daesc_003579 [Daldinia eschscholtzii]|uniref:Uncharacterized protein n=1 Tax=Daldinia eschscholtzii TaxID=292717 RepID=A0AAX6MUS4_9PEZI
MWERTEPGRANLMVMKEKNQFQDVARNTPLTVDGTKLLAAGTYMANNEGDFWRFKLMTLKDSAGRRGKDEDRNNVDEEMQTRKLAKPSSRSVSRGAMVPETPTRGVKYREIISGS